MITGSLGSEVTSEAMEMDRRGWVGKIPPGALLPFRLPSAQERAPSCREEHQEAPHLGLQEQRNW